MTDHADVPLQLFAPLPRAVEDALRASIHRFGVLVPVVKDQHGRILDGHHRSRIAEEEGVEYRVDVVDVADEDEAREMARTLNSDRRHLTEEQRRQVVALLAGETVAVGREEVARHSPPAIAKALGVSLKTVQDDIEQLTTTSKLTRPAKTIGQDGKVRPTRRSAPEPALNNSGPGTEGTPGKGNGRKRRPIGDAARDTGWALRKDVEKVERIFSDDRFAGNKKQVAAHLHSHLSYAVETLTRLLDHITHEGE